MPPSATPLTIGGLELMLAEKTFDLVSLHYGSDAWLLPAEPMPLWEIACADGEGRRARLTSAMAASSTRQADSGGVRLTWSDVVDPATGAGPFEVKVSILPHALNGASGGSTAWRISVRNASDAWTLWSVDFPRLGGLVAGGDGSQDQFIDGDGWGRQRVGKAIADQRRRYPRGWDCGMQLIGYTRGGRTLSLAAHDPRLSPKDFAFTAPRPPAATGGMSVRLFPEGMTLAGNGLSMQFDMIVSVLSGDWFDMARHYSAWARTQSWCSQPPVKRAGPKAIDAREVQCWQVLQFPDKPADKWGELMEALRQRFDARIGIQFYNWHQIPFDVSYPDYFPARPGFAELVARVRKLGFVAMPYINGRLWDINARSWTERNAERYAVKHSAERVAPRQLVPYLEDYGSGQKLSPMCIATSFWRETLVELCRRIVHELGCDGVYLDQIAAEKAELCCNREHGHLLGGGGWWLDGYRQLIREIRAAVGDEVHLTTENNWEGAIADFDGLLTWASYHDDDIPLFPAIYSGIAKTFGCSFHDKDIERDGGAVFAHKMGRQLVWGGQLGWGDLTPLLDPKHADLLRYLGDLVRVRTDLTATFSRGRMLRPPAWTGDSAPLISSWQGSDDPAAVVLVVNPTRDEIRGKVADRSITAPPLSVQVLK